jgi:hypothetical protein
LGVLLVLLVICIESILQMSRLDQIAFEQDLSIDMVWYHFHIDFQQYLLNLLNQPYPHQGLEQSYNQRLLLCFSISPMTLGS